tara:strand:- start:3457 stop:3927 length:471 start_codon:yes stop_codon:yes gene_type:complete
MGGSVLYGTKRKVIAVSDTRTLTTAESGATVLWTKGTAHNITLPAAAVGLNYKIVIKVSSDNLHKIAAASGDCFFGQVTVLDNADDKLSTQTITYATATGTVASYDHLKLDGNANDTGSGAGSVIELECVDSTAWRVTARLLTSGTPTSIVTIYAG